MTQPLLSILIPTVNGREESFKKLEERICGMMCDLKKPLYHTENKYNTYSVNNGIVELISYKDNKEITIGEKRERLYEVSGGLYSWQIDDDDDVSGNAIELILAAIKSNPEIPCVTFKEKCMINGVYKSSNHSIIYSQWMDNTDGYDYVRCPFYKDVIRTDIAKSVPFEKIRYNEDERWSMAIKPFLDQEIHIEEEIYYYTYNETNHAERYGIK